MGVEDVADCAVHIATIGDADDLIHLDRVLFHERNVTLTLALEPFVIVKTKIG